MLTAIETKQNGVREMSTYEMIKALPGKGANWQALVNALRDHYLSIYASKYNGKSPWPVNTTDIWNAAKGVRQLRESAMQAANYAVDEESSRSSFIPPSPETLQWGGFLGGEGLVWTDEGAEAEATARIAKIIESFR